MAACLEWALVHWPSLVSHSLALQSALEQHRRHASPTCSCICTRPEVVQEEEIGEDDDPAEAPAPKAADARRKKVKAEPKAEEENVDPEGLPHWGCSHMHQHSARSC